MSSGTVLQNKLPCDIFWSPVSKKANICWPSHYLPKQGWKGKKGAVVFDLIFYQFTSLFACGCDCNVKLTQFPGHYCSEAKQLFSCCPRGLYVWENFRDYSDISKKHYLSESSMNHVSPWSGRHNPFIPEAMESNRGRPNNRSDSSLEAFRYGS